MPLPRMVEVFVVGDNARGGPDAANFNSMFVTSDRSLGITLKFTSLHGLGLNS